MADTRFSQFANATTLTGAEKIVGLQSNDNAQMELSTIVLPYFNDHTQLESTSQVTGLDDALAAKLDLSGGTLTGAVIAAADPVLPLGLATKQYVDNSSLSIDLQAAYNNSLISEPPFANIYLTNDPSASITFFNYYDGINPSKVLLDIGQNGIYTERDIEQGTSETEFFRILTPDNSPTVALQLASTTRVSEPFPGMEQSARDAIPVSDAIYTGFIFNETTNTLDYNDLSQWQNILTIQNMLEGTNITFDKVTYPGKLVISSTGGGSSVDAIQGSFNNFVGLNTLSTTPSTSVFTPVAMDAAVFNVVHTDGTSVSIMNISGVNTPTIQNIDTGSPRWCQVTFDLTIVASSLSGQTYNFRIYTNNGSTGFIESVTVSNNNEPLSISGMVLLDTLDYAYLTVTSNLSFMDFNASRFNGILIDTTVAGIPDTNSLSQGTNNLYLSTNAGTSYEYLSGSAVVGNLTQFNSIGGQLIDSGISASSLVLTSGNQTINGIKTFSSAIISDVIGISTKTNTVNTLQTTTNATFYPAFFPSSTNSYQQSQISVGLTFNPNTNNLTTTTFTGSLVGNASTVTTNANLTGDVTSIGNATTLTTVNSNVGSFGSATQVANFTVNSKGLITAASNITISGVAPGGAAGGNLSGTYPNPSIGALQVTNAMLAGSIDLTSKVTGILPFAQGGFGFSTATTGDIFYASGTNTPNKLSDVATGSVLISGGVGVAPSYSSSPTLSGTLTANALTLPASSVNTTIDLGSSASTLSGVTPLINFSSNYSDGNYLKFGSSGAIGITASSRPFMSRNLDWDGTVGSYKYISSNFASGIEAGLGTVNILTCGSGTAGNTVTPTNTMSISNSSVSVIGQISISNGSNPSIQTDNTSPFQAKNSSGTYETWVFPRYSDNVMYLAYGSGGFNIRNNSATTAMFLTNGLDVQISAGNLLFQTAGKTLSIKTGVNAATGTVTLSGATTTVNTSAATTGDLIILQVFTPGGTQGFLSYSISNGVSFTITSTQGASDTSIIKWLIIHQT